MNNRSLIIVASILLVGIATNWIIGLTEEDPLAGEGPGNEPDIYIINAQITHFDQTGRRQHELSATRMTHFPLTDVTTMELPNLYLFGNDDAGSPWDIVATNGRLLPATQLHRETVELWDQVVAMHRERDGDFLHIETDHLLVYPDQDFAETDALVSIATAGGRTTAGGGMKAWLEEGRFQLFAGEGGRVNTVLSPERQADAG